MYRATTRFELPAEEGKRTLMSWDEMAYHTKMMSETVSLLFCTPADCCSSGWSLAYHRCRSKAGGRPRHMVIARYKSAPEKYSASTNVSGETAYAPRKECQTM